MIFLQGDHGVHGGFKKNLNVLHDLPVKNSLRLCSLPPASQGNLKRRVIAAFVVASLR
jgi:hypothetical protein